MNQYKLFLIGFTIVLIASLINYKYSDHFSECLFLVGVAIITFALSKKQKTT